MPAFNVFRFNAPVLLPAAVQRAAFLAVALVLAVGCKSAGKQQSAYQAEPVPPDASPAWSTPTPAYDRGTSTLPPMQDGFLQPSDEIPPLPGMGNPPPAPAASDDDASSDLTRAPRQLPWPALAAPLPPVGARPVAASTDDLPPSPKRPAAIRPRLTVTAAGDAVDPAAPAMLSVDNLARPIESLPRITPRTSRYTVAPVDQWPHTN